MRRIGTRIAACPHLPSHCHLGLEAGSRATGTVVARLPPDGCPGRAWTPAQGRGDDGARRQPRPSARRRLPRRHARTCSGHPRLAASRCAPAAGEAAEGRGCPEQVHCCPVKMGRTRCKALVQAGFRPFHRIGTRIAARWCGRVHRPVPPRHFDRSAKRGAEKSIRAGVSAPKRADFSAPPTLRAGSGRNDERVAPARSLNRTAVEQVRA